MFYHQSNFTDIGIDPDTANLVTKLANDILDKNSKVLYGTMYSDGKCTEFSTEKSRVDTHVCIAVDIAMMGNFKPSDSPIALDRPKKEDIERMQAQRILQLEREIKIERSK